jgi:hypothetical protein
MKKMTALDRILLLITGLLAAYQVAVGIDGLGTLPIWCYTTGFGVLLVAGLLMIILGFEALESPIVVIVSTLIPLSLALGLVAEFRPNFTNAYLIFAVSGFLALIVTRLIMKSRIGIPILIVVHGLAGLTIFGLPIFLAVQGEMPAGFALVGVGGALIGLGGLLLSFLKAGKPILSRDTILTVLPGLLLLTTAAFVLGFTFAR